LSNHDEHIGGHEESDLGLVEHADYDGEHQESAQEDSENVPNSDGDNEPQDVPVEHPMPTLEEYSGEVEWDEEEGPHPDIRNRYHQPH